MAEPVISSPHAESKRPFLTEQRRSRITAYTFISPFLFCSRYLDYIRSFYDLPLIL